MFPFGRDPHSSPVRSYNPYEQLRLEQEQQRRRQAEEHHRRQQLEELNRRRAEQLEYARRQAELQRHREAEARRLREMEIEARRRKLSEPTQARGSQAIGPGTIGARPRHSVFDGGVQDLFDSIYGSRARSNSPSSQTGGRRSVSSDPKSPRQRTVDAEQEESGPLAVAENAVSDTEEPSVSTLESAKPTPTDAAEPPTVEEDVQAAQVDTTPSREALAEILSNFTTLKSGFTFPISLDFLSSPEGIQTPAPKLAYTRNNAPLHQYEHLLTGLLTKLDAVDSYGDDGVRKARKDVVKQIEHELEELDGRKLQAWRAQFQPTPDETPAGDSAPEAERDSGPLQNMPTGAVPPQETSTSNLPESATQLPLSLPLSPSSIAEPDHHTAPVE